MRFKFSIIFFFVHILCGITQGIGIGTTTPNASALLEVQSSSKGVLVPRIALEAANISSPMTSPSDGLLVYNTEPSSNGANSLNRGYYYWSAAVSRWISIRKSEEEQNIGFGSWSDCSENKLAGYNPVAASDGMANDSFGFSVVVKGDFAAIGAPYDDIGAQSNRGSVYIFKYNGSAWIEHQKLTAIDGQANDLFGFSISISSEHLVIGAPGNNSSNGAVYYFINYGNVWTYQQKIAGFSGAGRFGHSVSCTNTYMWIGAPNLNANVGEAYQYTNIGEHWESDYTLNFFQGNINDFFGCSVSITDSFAIIGAYQFDVLDGLTTYHNAGAAFIYHFTGSGYYEFEQMVYSPSISMGGEKFGNSVSISGIYAAVGSETYDSGTNTDQGATYLLHHDNNHEWQILNAGTIEDNPGANYGHSVMISPDYLISGIPGVDIPYSTNCGQVSIRLKNMSPVIGYSYYKFFASPAGSPNDRFGASCYMDKHRFVVGATGAAGGRGIVIFGSVN